MTSINWSGFQDRVLHTASLLMVAATIGVSLTPLRAEEPTFRVLVDLAEHKLHISGVVDMPEGCIIEWEVRHRELYGRSSEDTDTTAAEGSATVHDGMFVADVDLDGWQPGTAEVWVALQPEAFGTPQPASTTAILGERGEKLSGPNVVTAGADHSMRRMVVERAVKLP